MRILLFADIHIGSIKDCEYVYNTITRIIDDEILAKHTDLVVILGDYFDRSFKVNEQNVSLAIDIMSYLVRACTREKTVIRMIYGTESHEMNQYILFNYHFTSKYVDVKVIDTVMKENINGCSILYIPEEYIDDKHDYYSKFLNSAEHYDYIFGHGIIEDGMPGNISSSHENNKNKEKQVPRFKSGELSAVGDICVFGHYHCHTKINSSVYYLGSLFRSSFGEESPKYYGIIDDKSISFIENSEAYVYKTYEFDPTSNIYSGSDNILTELNKIISENKEVIEGTKSGKIKLIFRTPTELDPSFKDNLRNLLSPELPIVTIIKEPNTELIDEIKEDLDDGDEFIIDQSLSVTDKIYRDMCMQNETPPMTFDELKSYLSKTSVASLLDRKGYIGPDSI